MAYVALKPCCFGGQRFRIGESIPADYIQQGAARNLIAMGRIADTDTVKTVETTAETTEKVEKMDVVVQADGDKLDLSLTEGGLQSFLDVITGKASAAEKTVAKMTDPDALILVHIADSRKSIKEAAQERAKVLGEQ